MFDGKAAKQVLPQPAQSRGPKVGKGLTKTWPQDRKQTATIITRNYRSGRS